MSVDLCIYCQQQPANSNEHIIATWLIDELEKVTGHATTGGTIEQNGMQKPIPITLNKKGKREFGFTSDMICRTCNSEWMNVMDEKVRRYIPTLLRGKEIEVSGKLRKTMAAWAVKTAITARFAHVNPNPVEGEWPKQLMNDKRPSPEWSVWLSRFIGGREFWYQQGDLDINEAIRVLPTSGQPPTRPPLSSGGVAMTLVLGQLCVQVIRVNSPAHAMTTDNAAAIHIWPSGHNSMWPPPEHLEDATLEAFAQRFYSGSSPVFLGVRQPVTDAPSQPSPKIFVRSSPISEEDLESDEDWVLPIECSCGTCGTSFPITHNAGRPLRDLGFPYAVSFESRCPNCGEVVNGNFAVQSLPGPSGS